MSEYTKGTVKFFDEDKGFGFIAGEDGDIFVHVSACKEADISITKGDVVEFTKTSGKGGKLRVDKIRKA